MSSSESYLDATLTREESPATAMDTYARQVGRRLRRVREERLYSLNDLQRESNDEFKMSVISAYERGERMMSVQGLDRLARFYEVPITQLLPSADDGWRAAAEPRRTVTIRLDRLRELDGEPFDRFRQLVRTIQEQRNDDRSDVVTLRADDLQAVASMFDVPADEMADRLTMLELLT